MVGGRTQPTPVLTLRLAKHVEEGKPVTRSHDGAALMGRGFVAGNKNVMCARAHTSAHYLNGVIAASTKGLTPYVVGLGDRFDRTFVVHSPVWV